MSENKGLDPNPGKQIEEVVRDLSEAEQEELRKALEEEFGSQEV